MSFVVTRKSPGQRRLGGVVALLFGMTVCLLCGFQQYRNWQFRGPVTHVQAIIDRLYFSSGHHSTACMAAYHYTAGGLTYSPKQQIGETTWNRLQEGQSVTVKYLTDEPSVSRIDLKVEDVYQQNRVYLPFAMGFVFLSVGCFMVMRAKEGRTYA